MLFKHVDAERMLVLPDYLTALTMAASLGVVRHGLHTSMAHTPREVVLFVTLTESPAAVVGFSG